MPLSIDLVPVHKDILATIDRGFKRDGIDSPVGSVLVRKQSFGNWVASTVDQPNRDRLSNSFSNQTLQLNELKHLDSPASAP
ncbi:hypothetical protein PGT21_000982 [Puccinia graminis f. sp. tritici]|uniref:Uncharacterized protein n=1 Tax=Puccinia graminis f. sp. tritici TaxID=56615 RepID=A0A5B0PEJ2_PUCGR|nr:hypothetical protein PGT21_000982 [Puccinia graminis f. sp. tritici]